MKVPGDEPGAGRRGSDSAPSQSTPPRSAQPGNAPKPVPASTTRTTTQSAESHEGREDEVRLRAYQLWEQRGKGDGAAEADWLEAEKEIANREQLQQKRAS